MTADLLAESVELTIGYGLAILSAARVADDDTILSSFRYFDAANRTVKACALELRGLLEARGAP